MRNSIEFEVAGDFALFTDPILGAGGGRCSLPVPTYSALKGLCCAIYEAPLFEWSIDSVRIMNSIRMEEMPLHMRFQRAQELDCCLRDVRYQVRAQLVRTGAASLRGGIPEAHSIAARSLERGGRRGTYLGKSRYACDVTPCRFGEGISSYDSAAREIGLMFHSYECRGSLYYARMFQCVMRRGVISFPRPAECEICCPVGRAPLYALA